MASHVTVSNAVAIEICDVQRARTFNVKKRVADQPNFTGPGCAGSLRRDNVKPAQFALGRLQHDLPRHHRSQHASHGRELSKLTCLAQAHLDKRPQKHIRHRFVAGQHHWAVPSPMSRFTALLEL